MKKKMVGRKTLGQNADILIWDCWCSGEMNWDDLCCTIHYNEMIEERILFQK